MVLFFYNIGIQLYKLAILLLYPFHKKARLWVDGRKEYFVTLQRKMYKNSKPLIWFHAASLGEFEQCRPIIEKFKEELPEYGIILTFFSPSGYEIRKNYEYADLVFYLPLDTPFNAKKFVRVVNPKLALFAKYEFWFHFINQLDNKKIPAICFSSIFRREQIFFKPQGGFFRALLKKFNRIFVQDEHSLKLLKEINIQNTTVAGDTRFDRVLQICGLKKTIPVAEEFKGNSKVMVAGSVWEEDMKVLLPIINDSGIEFKTIIAPHEISEQSIHAIEKSVKKKTIRYSQAEGKDLSSYDVLIIDNIGMLSSLYQYGYVAYVGGAFGKGLHNILEPACFGLPIFFGSEYKKFREAVELTESKLAFSVRNEKELKEKFDFIMTNEVERNKLAAGIKYYVEKNSGASQQIFNYCKNLLTR